MEAAVAGNATMAEAKKIVSRSSRGATAVAGLAAIWATRVGIKATGRVAVEGGSRAM